MPTITESPPSWPRIYRIWAMRFEDVAGVGVDGLAECADVPVAKHSPYGLVGASQPRPRASMNLQIVARCSGSRRRPPWWLLGAVLDLVSIGVGVSVARDRWPGTPAAVSNPRRSGRMTGAEAR